jgi:putative phosphoribosyl transferase
MRFIQMDNARELNDDVQPVRVSTGGVSLEGDLSVPPNAQGLVLFAHGSGSSRLSPRNRFVADVLSEAGLATLLMDLLTAQEEGVDIHTRHLRFNIGLLSERLVGAIGWLGQSHATRDLSIGVFGASTGAAAALVAAVERPEQVQAVVSRGGRPDLAAPVLDRVRAPTLLIVGSADDIVIGLNRDAFNALRSEKQLEIIPGATHLFEEPGALDEVARLARDWFQKFLVREPARAKIE